MIVLCPVGCCFGLSRLKDVQMAIEYQQLAEHIWQRVKCPTMIDFSFDCESKEAVWFDEANVNSKCLVHFGVLEHVYLIHVERL